MTNETTQAEIDPAAAARAEAAAEIAALTGRIATYDKATGALERQMAPIQEELDAINSERNVLRQDLQRAERKLDVAEYSALAGTEEGRRARFQAVQSAALAQYRQAQTMAGSPKETIERAWSAVVYASQTEQRSIGQTRPDGSISTQIEWEATFYKRFVALAQRMAELAGLSLEERLRIGAEDRRRAA